MTTNDDPYTLGPETFTHTETIFPDYISEVNLMRCKKCKGTQFTIGQREYGECETVAKCPNCGWTEIIHSG